MWNVQDWEKGDEYILKIVFSCLVVFVRMFNVVYIFFAWRVLTRSVVEEAERVPCVLIKLCVRNGAF